MYKIKILKTLTFQLLPPLFFISAKLNSVPLVHFGEEQQKRIFCFQRLIALQHAVKLHV